jgi:hypothetical protein
MIGLSARLIGGDANVAMTVRISAIHVTDVVDAALVVCVGGHLRFCLSRLKLHMAAKILTRALIRSALRIALHVKQINVDQQIWPSMRMSMHCRENGAI